MRILVTGGSGFIGTNLTKLLHEKGISFINLDVSSPKESSLDRYWVPCSILNYAAIDEQFHLFRPTAVIHLAAETDTDPSKTLTDYLVNTEGTQNIINAIKSTNVVERLVHTSTQFVNQSINGPLHDEDYDPHTIYGESKITNEKQIRTADLKCTWTIIRPTNIWGPWHLRYPFEFWKILAEGKYFHPGSNKVIRSYGYVGNVVSQIMKILELPAAEVNRKVYYVGDRPVYLYEWVNGFSIGQTGKKVVVLPRFFIYSLALLGDLLRLIRIRFPITTPRYKSMTTDNPVNIDKTLAELGEPPYSLQQGIEETVKWMKLHHPRLVKI